jgi:ABC-type multidrug transport system permease subunit
VEGKRMRIEKKIQRTRMRRNGRISVESVYYAVTGEVIIIIIIIIIFINCNWVITRWQWLFYMYTNMERKKEKSN